MCSQLFVLSMARPPHYRISLQIPYPPPLLRPTPHLPSVRPPTTISTAPSPAPPSLIPRSSTSPTLPHRLLIHLILAKRVRIPSILNATTAIDRARHSVFIVVSAEVAVVEITVTAVEVDAFFVAHCAWEWRVGKGGGEARRREGGCGSCREGERG